MSNDTQQATIEGAQARVGARAMLTRGILRGAVTVRAYRLAYGRLEYLAESEHGEKQWVRESSLAFGEGGEKQ